MSVNASVIGVSADEATRLAHVQELAAAGAEGVDALVEMLVEPSWAVRRGVVAALASIGKPAAAALCATLLQDRRSETRVAAAVDALAALGGDVDGVVIGLAADTNDAAVICDAVQILGRRKSAVAVPTLARLLSHTDDNVAVGAVEALGRIGTADAVEPLIAAMRSRNFFRTFPTIDVLGRTGDPRVVAPLAELLAEPIHASEAARALGRSGLAAAVPPLRTAVVDADDALSRSATDALVDLAARYESRMGDAGPIWRALRVSASTPLLVARLARTVHGASAPEIVSICALLGALEDEGALDLLSKLVDDADPRKAEHATLALSRAGEAGEARLRGALHLGDSARRARLLPLVGRRRASLPELLACLEDDDANVRALACEALGRIGDSAALAPLFLLLADADARVSQSAQGAIQSLDGQKAKPQALRAAESGDARVRRAGIRILSYFGYDEGLGLLLAALDDPDARIRDAATYGLPFLEDPRALAALLAATKHAEARTRAAALRALGQTSKAPAVVDALRAGIEDPDAWARYYACQSAGKLGLRALSGAVGACVDDPAGQVRVAALEALARLGGDDAWRALEAAAASPDEELRRAALLGIGSTARLELLPTLLSALLSPSASTRLIALCALPGFDSADADDALAKAASDTDENVRNAAIGALGTKAGARATRALIAEASVPANRERALTALSLPAEGRVEALVESLETADARLSEALVAVLASMRHPHAHAALEAVLEMSNPPARRAAARALAALLGPSARAALERAQQSDPDEEVRRIAAAAAR